MNIPEHKRNKAGRPKGALNKRTLLFVQVLEEKKFCPASAMIECYNLALQSFHEAEPREAPAYLSTASNLVSNIASYAYPKLKATEFKNYDQVANMSLKEKLQVLKDHQILIESQIKEEEEQNGTM